MILLPFAVPPLLLLAFVLLAFTSGPPQDFPVRAPKPVYVPLRARLRSSWRELRARGGRAGIISGLLFWGCVLYVIVAGFFPGVGWTS